MKKIIFVIALSSLFSCTGEKLDMNAARKTAESAIQLIADEKYDELSKLYTPDFRDGEEKKLKELKFSQIIHIIGKMQEYSLLDSSRVTTDEVNR
ncbi:MAG: hypothetical protein WCG32_02770, partial [Actinomycetes bacterium]